MGPGGGRKEDEQHLHVQSNSTMDHSTAPNDEVLTGSPNGTTDADEGAVKFRYEYPLLRFSVVFRVVVFLCSVVTIVLWLTGGDSEYFIQNIKHYDLVLSVFDIALISFLTCPLYFTLAYYAEKTFILSIDVGYNTILKSRQKKLFMATILLSFAVAAFSIVKGGLILKEILRNDSYPGMHSTYYACVIWTITTNMIILLLSCGSGLGLRMLARQRVKKLYNREGQEVDKEGKVIPRSASLLRLVSLAKPEAPLIIGGTVMLLFSSGVQTVGPLFFGKVVDAALKSMDELNKTVLILMGIYLVGSVSSLVRSWLFTLAGQRLVARLRSKLFGSVIVQDIAFFDVNRTGELCNRLSSDTQVLQNALTVNISMLVRYLLQILGSLGLMFYLNASLTGVLLAVVPIVSLAAVRYGKFVRKMRQKFQDRLADAGTQAEESLSSVRTVRSFAGELKAIDLYTGTVMESYNIGKKLALAQGTMDGLFSFLGYGAVTAVLWYGGKLVHDNTVDSSTGITAGLLTSFLLYTLQVAMGFALLSSLYGDFMQAVGASVRIFTLLDRKPEMFQPVNPVVLPSLSGEIEFKNVMFKYPSRPENDVLKKISFRVEPGQTVALVGPSGGGKSTIVSMIERFYDPNEGTITLGGVDLRMLDHNWLRQKVSMVGQEPTLFAYSIRENIAYGRGATDEEVQDAAKQANAHEFVSSFEEGYNTLVGERGVRLSGGQKQRIAIARALIMNPVLLLLDEATSALDAESEHLVQEAIDRAMERRTVIVIAHRLSTVRNANKVIVIDQGEIAEMGTHSELLAHDGVYKRLVLRQLMAGDDSRDDGLLDSSSEEKKKQLDGPSADRTDTGAAATIGGQLQTENGTGGKEGFVNEGFHNDSVDHLH
ncbi:ABC transporter B family member 25 [Aplysia californica]|uniref:ABC transporter B family member 25 n=1 Tax=Aplysia californica TaxID=6500 RepID=A0ABM1W3U2_APLCA|nr:ABC transporter B family member 25 [Aplysia californica]